MADYPTYDFAVLGIHDWEVATVEGEQVRIRMFFHDLGLVVDEDLPYFRPFTDAALAERVAARMDAIRGGSKDTKPKQVERIEAKGAGAKELLGRRPTLAEIEVA